MKTKFLTLIILVFLTGCKSKEIITQENFYGKYIYENSNKIKNGDFYVSNEIIYEFTFFENGTYDYVNNIISKSDVITFEELEWNIGKWKHENGFLILNSDKNYPRTEIKNTNNINKLKIKVLAEDFFDNLDSNLFDLFICPKNGECFKTKSENEVTFNDKYFYLKIIPKYDEVKKHWIINTKELVSDDIQFPLDENGMSINLKLKSSDFTNLKFENKSIKIKNINSLKFDSKILKKAVRGNDKD